MCISFSWIGPLRVAIIGSGNWGSCVAKIIGTNTRRAYFFEPKVRMYVWEEEYKGNEHGAHGDIWETEGGAGEMLLCWRHIICVRYCAETYNVVVSWCSVWWFCRSSIN